MIFLGAIDLSIALGMPGMFDSVRFQQAFDRIAAATRDAGKFLGVGGIYDDAITPAMIRRGARFVAGGSDQGFMMAAAMQRAQLLGRFAATR